MSKNNYCNWPNSYEPNYSTRPRDIPPNTEYWFSKQTEIEGDNTLEVTAERDKDSTGSGDSGRGASEEGEGRGKLRPGEQPLSPSTMANQPPPLKKRSSKHPPGAAPKRHSKLNKPPLVSPPSQSAVPANYLLPPADSTYIPLVHATPTRVATPGSVSNKSDNSRKSSGEGPQISKQVLV
ncbi:hypothetical protein NP493_112g04045 [Ridgeia piscesae]|uniref:Uncharacterized protein n=1 Tax=Ridgeia piscesae TaxID=27915 RepID=A0AAD9P6U4_RIDPI|nr:hypothetical protein NP493_112g04045 [Ridgeia piscesae]